MDEDLIELRSGDARARINPQGAELYALQDADGRDYLWNGDPEFWSYRAPLLFPIIGVLNQGSYRIGEERFFLEKHGFARKSRFEVLEADGVSARFRLQDSEATRAVYPFAFRLDVRYLLEGPRLTIQACVSNRDTRPLPASFGFHPALRWPPPEGDRSRTELLFERDEPEEIRRVDENGLFRPEPQPTPVRGRSLHLEDDLFTHDAVIFDRLRSTSCVLQSGAGPRVRASFPETPFLGVWSKRGAPFVCVEAWHGHSDPEGWTGDFYDKPGAFVLQPGAEKILTLSLELPAS